VAANRVVADGLAGVLTAKQAKRLRQIVLQQTYPTQDLLVLLTVPAVAEELKLSAEQRANVAGLRKEQIEAIQKAILSGDEAAKITQNVADAKKDVKEKAGKVLDAGQQALLKELVGEPFTARLQVRPRFAGRNPDEEVSRGLYYLELAYLAQPAVQNDLKLSPEQAKKAAEALAKWQEEYLTELPRGTRESVEKLSPITEKALGDVLDAGQRRRFREIMLQQHQRTGGLAAVCDYPGVAAELKLTAEQRERLQAGEAVEKVLGAEQLTKAKDLLGEPFQADLRRVRPIGPPGRTSVPRPLPPASLAYLLQAPVQKELGLTETQAATARDVEAKRLEAFKDYPTLTVQERSRKRREVTAEVEKSVTTLLDAAQRERLQQIILQQQRAIDLASALSSPAVSEELKLTAEQRTALRDVERESSEIRLLIGVKLSALEGWSGLAAPPLDPDEMMTAHDRTMAAFAEITEAKLLKVLTPAQQVRWTELLGKPVEGPLRRRALSPAVN
jgi:hypothetical protein